MAKQSKFFRVAVEGATCDGREISRQDIVDMAATYNRVTYGARVNMEHIRGFSASPPFNAYGDVLAVRTGEVELMLGGKPVKKLTLEAQIEPTDDLVALNAKSQKIYTSIEINPNFAETKKAYLQGLAITDSPASLGTEILAFAAGMGANNPFASRKQDPGNFFSAASETALEFEDAPATPATETAGLFAAATEFFKNFGKTEKPADPVVPPVSDPKTPANDNMAAEIGQGFTKLTELIAAQSRDFKAVTDGLRTDFTAFKTAVENTDGDQQRRGPADGRGNFAKAEY